MAVPLQNSLIYYVILLVYSLNVTVYAEIGHLSAKLNFKYAPWRQKRNGLAKLLFLAHRG